MAEQKRNKLGASQAGSNYLAAQRFGEKEGLTEEQIWGPHVQGSSPEQIAVNREKQYIESAPTATTETASARMAGRGSSYPTAAGSNYLAAERDASNRDVSDDQLWGTGEHHHNIDLNNPEQQRQQREWK